MRLINWAQAFKEKPYVEDIIGTVQKTEITYWIWLGVSCVIFLPGVMMLFGPSTDFKQNMMGLFLGLVGIMQITFLKIWVNIRLSMLWLLWDNRNRIEAEIRKSQAQDL